MSEEKEDEQKVGPSVGQPAPSALDVGRRNTAAHQFRVRAAEIAKMGQRELNSVQRGARKAGPRRRSYCSHRAF